MEKVRRSSTVGRGRPAAGETRGREAGRRLLVDIQNFPLAGIASSKFSRCFQAFRAGNHPPVVSLSLSLSLSARREVSPFFPPQPSPVLKHTRCLQFSFSYAKRSLPPPSLLFFSPFFERQTISSNNIYFYLFVCTL